ncbi:peptidase M13 family protein [Janthinobacterium sp. HH01]|uniref:M13 family metallopeptidase n=1 Tax=Janthinobacterium sp. HH01 TaxID=1198452 RepID=UPI0002AECE04|nr:M13 family metallopeptidase [Janthinobacterium sp. HH01]ELX13514.1 peptidase M13 family protein [Janthinobacterium sp. HH01]
MPTPALLFRPLACATLGAALLCSAQAAAPDNPLTSPHYGAWGFDLSGMDQAIRPGNDFFKYANGSWSARTPIPADEVKIGYFDDLDKLADRRTRRLVEDAASTAAPGGDQAKIGALYRAFMDTGKLEARAGAPLRADLNRLRAVASRSELARFMGDRSHGFPAAPFSLELDKDMMAPDRYVAQLGQDGLGLPNRDYYLTDQFAASKRAYQAYIGRMLTLARWDGAAAMAGAVLRFESRVAAASLTIAQQRDLGRGYVTSTPRDLLARAPGFDWPAFFQAAELGEATKVVLSTEASIVAIAAVYADTPLAVLKAWQAFRMTDGAAPYLSKAYADAHFAFHATQIAGQSRQKPRWQRAIAAVNDVLGAAVGKLYVAAYLPDDAAAKMRELTANLSVALRTGIEQLPWMSPDTRATALRKLAAFEVQIGAPLADRDYADLRISDHDLYGDMVRANAFDWHRRVKALGAPWDKSAWRFWPQYATAYTENGQLIFTASMLQAPFFDAAADAAVNYGAMGAVIGHELTHGFDDQGRHVDADRRLRDWWSASDAQRFQQQAQRLSAQYAATEILPGLHLNGDATLGENIADLGGLKIALTAYHLSLQGKPAPVIDGYSGDQRVFLSWAQGWRMNLREDALRRQVASNVHSPAQARVNNVVRNIDEWYDAFHVLPGDALYVAPADRVRIW